MKIENWDEFRTAYQVARLGTVSAAAAALGVHHATVIRHIDALEAQLGTRLFQRHARGYTATEAGEALLQVAATMDDQLTQLVGRLRGQAETLSGELIVTAVTGMTDFLMPAIAAFQADFPDVRVALHSDMRIYRLEYGEAHVAIRGGPKPQEPDNVAQSFLDVEMTLYAHESYVARYGLPRDHDDFAGHRFVSTIKGARMSPAGRWLEENVAPEQIVFRGADGIATDAAVRAGIGMGFLGKLGVTPACQLTEVLPPRPEWIAPTWLVTHVDLHRTPKVQKMLEYLKAERDRKMA